MSDAHTPGPWLVSPPSDSSDYEVFAPETNYVVAGEWGISELYDAHLIAAAPAMLVALQLVRMSAGWQALSAESRAVIDDAVAKATGAAS